MKLRKKIAMFFIFSCILPVIMMMFYILGKNTQSIEDISKKEVEKSVVMMNRVIEQEVEKGSLALDYIRNTVLDQGVGTHALQRALYDIIDSSVSVRKVYYIDDSSGRVDSYPSNQIANIKSTEWYRDARRNRRHITLNKLSSNDGRVTMTISRVVDRGSDVLGVAAIDVDLSDLFSELDQERYLSSYILIDKNTKTIIYPEKQNFNDFFVFDMTSTLSDEEFERVNKYTDLNVGTINYYRRDLRNLDWVLIGKIGESDLKSAYVELKYIAFGSVVMIIVFSLMSILLMENIFVDPLVKMKEKFKQASNGNYGARIFVDNGDEIGDICSEFNYLMKKINRKIKKLEEGTRLGVSKEQVENNTEINSAVDALSDYDRLDSEIDKDIKTIIDEEANFKSKSKDLAHSTFDEWKSEYYKTINENKIK